MTESKHTPGPWSANDQLTFVIIHGPKGEHIADTGAWRDDEKIEMQANALLIAESPNLLAALEGLLAENSVATLEEAAREYPHGKEDVASVLEVFDNARTAIAKAKGASQ